MTQAFDVLEGRGPVPNIHDAFKALESGAPLPYPFSPAVVLPPAVTQYVVTGSQDGWVLVKHWTFNLRATFQRVQDACVGKLYMFDMTKVPSNRHSGHIVQHILSNMGGVGIFNKELKVTREAR